MVREYSCRSLINFVCEHYYLFTVVGKVRVFVKRSANKLKPLDIEASDTLEMMKAKIFESEGK